MPKEFKFGLDEFRDLFAAVAIGGGLLWAMMAYAIIGEYGSLTLVNSLYILAGVTVMFGLLELATKGLNEPIYNTIAGIGMMYAAVMAALQYYGVVISQNVVLGFAAIVFVWGILEIAQRRE